MESKKQQNSKDSLNQARCLLSKIAKAHEERDKDQHTWDNTNITEALALCFDMAKSFHRSTSCMEELSIADCAVVRAIIELIVRWGISPYLSPGVGIRRERKSREKEAQEAVAHHLAVSSSSLAPGRGKLDGDILLASCDLLASFAMNNLSHRGFCVSLVVRNYYLVDIMAGFLQLAYGPVEEDGTAAVEERRKAAVCKLEAALGTLEVADTVETFLALVGQRDPPPPAWLKSEVGKLLSRLVLREGGVAAVMQNLLGPGIKGDVCVYNNVASHLAKVPKHVANTEEYYRAVCPQILPFLPYPKSAEKKTRKGETAQQILRNMHHTSSLLACNMIVREPELSETYILKPIVVHLVKWYRLQTDKAFSENPWNEDKGQELTESLIVQNLMQLHALLTAGHKDANKVKKVVLEKTRLVLPALMILHYLLETYPTSKPFWDKATSEKRGLGTGKVKQVDKKGHNIDEKRADRKAKQADASVNEERDKSVGIKKGFLDINVSQISDEDEDFSTLGRLKVLVTDLTIAHVCELPEDLSHLMLGFLSDLDVKKFTWPSKEGDIWNALNPKHSRSHTLAEYLSRLLLAFKKWSLVVRLMGDILRKVFNIHQSLKMELFYNESNRESSPLNSVLQMMQSFETLNEIVGSKALECDSLAASTLVQDLLNEPTLLHNEDMVELVLYMVHSVLNGFSSQISEEGLDKVRKDILICMSASLERICSSQLLTEKVKRMSSTLNTRICSLVAS